MTGGALGSLMGQQLRITGAERKTLLVAGAVAGMTAIFGTPIAAVMLAVELLLFELRPRSLLPVAMACAVAAYSHGRICSTPDRSSRCRRRRSPRSVFSPASSRDLRAARCPGLCRHRSIRSRMSFSRLPIHWMWWPAIGAVVVGVGGYLQPRALGVGYDVIGDLLQQSSRRRRGARSAAVQRPSCGWWRWGREPQVECSLLY